MKKCIFYRIPPPPPLGVKVLILNYPSTLLICYSATVDTCTNSEFRNSILILVTITRGAFFN